MGEDQGNVDLPNLGIGLVPFGSNLDGPEQPKSCAGGQAPGG